MTLSKVHRLKITQLKVEVLMERIYVGALVSTFCAQEDLKWYLCSHSGREIVLITGTIIEICGDVTGRLIVKVKKGNDTREYHLTPSELGL